MSNPLARESDCFKAMEKAGLTEDQIEAIFNLIEYKSQGVIDYLKDIEMHDMETRLEKMIGTHRHIGTDVVKPF